MSSTCEYEMILHKNAKWHQLEISCDRQSLLDDYVTTYTKDGHDYIAFKKSTSVDVWWGSVPVPIRKAIMRQLERVEVGRVWSDVLEAGYYPKRDNPRQRPKKNTSTKHNDWRALTDIGREELDIPRQKDLF